jgi:hypothetical protein
MANLVRALQVSLNLRSVSPTQSIRSKYIYWIIF